jgi:anti-sigma B factor antagonist
MDGTMDFDLITSSSATGHTVVRVSGDVDISTAPFVVEHCQRLLRSGNLDLVVDLEGVTFIDSTGLSALFSVLKRVRVAEGTLQVVCSHARVVRLFRITGLPKDFIVHDTLPQALAMAC